MVEDCFVKVSKVLDAAHNFIREQEQLNERRSSHCNWGVRFLGPSYPDNTEVQIWRFQNTAREDKSASNETGIGNSLLPICASHFVPTCLFHLLSFNATMLL